MNIFAADELSDLVRVNLSVYTNEGKRGGSCYVRSLVLHELITRMSEPNFSAEELDGSLALAIYQIGNDEILNKPHVFSRNVYLKTRERHVIERFIKVLSIVHLPKLRELCTRLMGWHLARR